MRQVAGGDRFGKLDRVFDGCDVGIDAAVCGPDERGQVGGALDGGNRAAALPRCRQDVFHVPQHHVVTDGGALDALKSVAHFACQLLQAGQNLVKRSRDHEGALTGHGVREFRDARDDLLKRLAMFFRRREIGFDCLQALGPRRKHQMAERLRMGLVVGQRHENLLVPEKHGVQIIPRAQHALEMNPEHLAIGGMVVKLGALLPIFRDGSEAPRSSAGAGAFLPRAMCL